MLKEIPQEGDVWECSEMGRVHVERVGTTGYGVQMCITWNDRQGYMMAAIVNVDSLADDATLIERDGKPHVELRVGAWYPIEYKGERAVMFCDGENDYRTEIGNFVSRESFHWIGPEIKIDWPEEGDTDE